MSSPCALRAVVATNPFVLVNKSCILARAEILPHTPALGVSVACSFFDNKTLNYPFFHSPLLFMAVVPPNELIYAFVLINIFLQFLSNVSIIQINHEKSVATATKRNKS